MNRVLRGRHLANTSKLSVVGDKAGCRYRYCSNALCLWLMQIIYVIADQNPLVQFVVDLLYKFSLTRNAWQSLAYCPLGVAVSPPP